MPTSNFHERFADSSTDEFHRLFLQNQRRIYGYVLTLLPNLNDAEEVVQDVSVIVLSKADQWVPGTDFARWACQIAHFEVMNFRRRRQNDRLLFSDDLIQSLAAKHEASGDLFEARREALRTCIGKLAASDRELVLERYQSQRNSRDVATSLGRPSNTVYKALSRIRRALLECIERRIRSGERAV